MGSVLGIGGDAGRGLSLPLFHIAESLPNHRMLAMAFPGHSGYANNGPQAREFSFVAELDSVFNLQGGAPT